MSRLALAAITLALAAPAMAEDVPPPQKFSPAQLDAIGQMQPMQLKLGYLPVGKNGPVVVVLQRGQTGEVEIHETINDVFVVRSGKAEVRVGGTVSGNRSTGPGEWRGGTVSGAQAFTVQPGDVLWIPAGTPHQVVLQGKAKFSYLTFKSPLVR